MKQKLLDAIEKAKANDAEYISYGSTINAVRIDDAISYIQQLNEDLGNSMEDLTRWFECNAAGQRIFRAKEIYDGITRHGTGVIVWDGSSNVFCGSWIGAQGIPPSFDHHDEAGTGKKLVAVSLNWNDLDEDTLELAFNAAHSKGDKSPSISEVFRINDAATIITFDGWD
jgi:hypothetical protein